MLAWLFPIFLLFVWLLWAAAGATQVALEDAQKGVPEGKRRGTSFVPVIPLFPLAFWAMAWIVDRFANPWGTAVVGGLHLVYGAVLALSIIRSSVELRRINRA